MALLGTPICAFGQSARSEEVLRHFGFNVEPVIDEVKRLLA